MGHELHRISGVDLTRIDGIDVSVAQTVISEVGVDMTRWKTEAHFASWLGLCPDNRITGGKVIRKGTRHVVNRAATALRLAATTLLRSTSYLGAQFPSPPRPTRCAQGHHRDGAQARPFGVSHAHVGARVQSTKVCSTTRSATANSKCTCSRSGRQSWDCKSSNPKLPNLLGKGPVL